MPKRKRLSIGGIYKNTRKNDTKQIVLVMALGTTVIALSSYLAYRELCKIWREHDILIQYGNLFLTPEDVQRLNTTTHPWRVPVDPQDRSSDGFCFSNCTRRNSYLPRPCATGDKNHTITPGEKLSSPPQENLLNKTGNSSTPVPDPVMAMSQAQTDLVHHACCNSHRRIITPVRVRNIYGHSRLVVQFRNRNQVFFTDECYQARGCDGCQCTQMMATYAAVVINDDGRDDDGNQPRRRNFAGYRLELIRVPGCCKCLNNAT